MWQINVLLPSNTSKQQAGNGSGPPPPDTIGFWAAPGGRHTILIFGAGARERHFLPRSAA